MMPLSTKTAIIHRTDDKETDETLPQARILLDQPLTAGARHKTPIRAGTQINR